MSVHVSSWAWKQTVGDPAAKLLLMKLAENANDDGVAWPNRHTLAAQTELSVRTIVRKIQYLADRGLVEVQRRQRSSNVYFLKCQPDTSTGDLEVPSSPVRSANSGTREPSIEPSVPEANASGRKPDPLWEVLVQEIGPVETRSERGRRNAALKELRDIDASPVEVARRCEAYRRMWPDMELTASALVSNWSRLTGLKDAPKQVRRLRDVDLDAVFAEPA